MTWQRTLVALATFVLVILVIGCLHWGRSVLIPVALAILLTFVLSPVVGLIQRCGLPRVPSVILVVASAALILAAIGWVMAAQVQGLVHDLPQYQNNVTAKINALRKSGSDGFFSRIQAFTQKITEEIRKPVENDETKALATDNEKPQPVKVVEDETSPTFGPFVALLEPFVAPLASVGLSIILVIFMLIHREDLRDRLISLVGPGQITVTTKALDDAGERISRYLLMQLVVNSAFGLSVGIGLFILDVPYAPLWGFLGAVLRYIPYIGPWMAAILPVALSLLVSEGWAKPLTVIGLFLTLELITNLVMEPLLYGKSIGVSEAALLVAVAFWTWLWGAIGLVLATPLTVILVVLGKYVSYLRFFDVLLGDKPAFGTDVGFYQRMLAKDQDEAADIVEEQLKERSLEQVYEEVLIPALVYARRDLDKDNISEADAEFIVEATRELVEQQENREMQAMEADAETKGAKEAQATDGATAAGPKIAFVGLPARDDADEVALLMLKQMLDDARLDVEVVSSDKLVGEVLEQIDATRPAIVCIAALAAGGLAHTRYLCKRLRGRFPNLKIVVGRWGLKGDVDKDRQQLVAVGADHIGVTFQETVAHISSLLPVLAAQTAKPKRSLQSSAELAGVKG